MDMHTIKPLFFCLFVWLIPGSGNLLGQQQDDSNPAPRMELHSGPMPGDTMGVARSSIDQMHVLKPDLSKMAKMPIMKVDSLPRFPMPNPHFPRSKPYTPGKKDNMQKPNQ